MSKNNKCPIDSSSSSDKDFREYQYRQHNHRKTDNPLSHICKYLDVNGSQKSSKENVELALEVEINESLKHVLTGPDSNNSDLLDVTIIRPSDSDTTHETTVALNKEEVRDFISLVEQHHRHQNGTSPKENRSKNEDNVREDNQRYRSSRQKQDGKSQSQKADDKGEKLGDEAKHVYTTVNTFDSTLKQTLPCQNRGREGDKPGTPCMCQHCGVVGVLVQSQKGPVAPFPPLEESRSGPSQRSPNRTRDGTPIRRDSKIRRVADVRKKKSLDQLQLLREINARIRSLEKRITIQEETAVPREYLKQILHKVLTQYNFRANSPNIKENKLRNNATQYSAKNIAADSGGQKNHLNSNKKTGEDKKKCFQVHTVLEDHPAWLDYSKNNAKTTKVQVQGSSRDHVFWRWGEEIVKPGCDLKSKIMKLLDDKLGGHRLERTQDPPTRASTPRSYFDRPEKMAGDFNGGGIKVERDDKTINLNNVDNTATRPISNYNYLIQGKQPDVMYPDKDEQMSCNKSIPAPPLPSNNNKFSNFRNLSPKSNYPFDVKKTLDDSTFKKNIEAQKEKFKEKHVPNLEEKFFNATAAYSITTESQASINYILQKLKHNAKIVEAGLPREKEQKVETMFKLPKADDVPGSVIKENLNRYCFRSKKPEEIPTKEFVDVKFVNPNIRQWSEESSTSEDKLMRQKMNGAITKEPVTLEKKESLIYKLDFLKNLAKNKSTDQSRVLNRIWNQAKNTAKSKKDAVYIKIPFKNINAREQQNNLIEMHLTLEELETVVKSAKMSSTGSSRVNYKIDSFKSTSEIDLGQRKHEEMKYANREILKRRQLSAKANRHKERRQVL